MSTVESILATLEQKSNPATIRTYGKHGAPVEKLFGVSVADMKVIAKTIKGQQELACELYDTGNGDAMYLAGMVADGSLMSTEQLDAWADNALWSMISEYTVPWVATEHPQARELALRWIESPEESVASSGWCTYAGLVAVTPDDDLDMAEIEGLLRRVEEQIDSSANRVRYTMNGFVIAVGSYVPPLVERAKETARALGKVKVNMGGTACKVPLATAYIEKVEKAGRVGKKRKTIKC